MNKVTITIDETLTYKREVEIEIPDEMTEDELEKLFSLMGREDEMSAALMVLERRKIAVGSYDTDLSSPDYMEIEVTDYEGDFE